jgi:hypothetical protein
MRHDFPSAASDYLFLVDKGYPETPSVRLVGDRYRLSREERTMLFRGVCPARKARERREKLSPVPCSPEICLDGYNVLFTILNYRQGRKLFVASDGFLRDAGSLHGRVSDQDLLAEIARDLFGFLRERGAAAATVLLDAPISRSGEHAALFRGLLAGAGLGGGCEVCASADGRLKALRPACAATSDTAIIDALPGKVYDLARDYLESRYAARFFAFPGPD